jgi:cyclopropane fatty-acyl-phospholipid synthase-like methyltransferase
MPSLRDISDEDARKLPIGAAHYMSFVGAPSQYDLRGGAQFALLFALGLRDHHRLLDFGCGSLRFGRLAIPYLQAGNYVGLEPNTWLVEDAIERQVGRDQIAIKRPTFHAFDDFCADRCGTGFDFIVAQSIFSHAGRGIIATALGGFRRALAGDGLALATFALLQDGQAPDDASVGWVYPGGVRYAPETVAAMIAESGLVGRALPWFHPRQTWYALALGRERLPPPQHDVFLRGAVLNTPAWEASLTPAGRDIDRT